MLIAASPPPGPRTGEATYSNTGFAIAGLVLQRAAGEPVAAATSDEAPFLPALLRAALAAR